MGQESDRVIRVLERMLDGMVRKNPDLLRSVLSEDMVLVHMTGTRQTREQFLAQLMDGTLNYRSARIVDAPVTIDGDRAEVRLLTETVAAVYGGGYRRWDLALDTELRNVGGEWVVTRSEAGTFRSLREPHIIKRGETVMQNTHFPEVNGYFGFGLMRLPQKDGDTDMETLDSMVDAFIGAGFNYFDTARPYHNGRSETSFRDSVTRRYDRKDFLIADKLTEPYFNKQEDIVPFFESQLEACGVEYFDFYLMHAQDKNNYKKFQRCKAYETACELKKQGRIRHFGISFHDNAEMLDTILTEHPEVEFVQIQLNYVDYEDPSVEGRKVYETCAKHGKPAIVMEPVKGGSLVNLPEEADKVLRSLNGGSNASYALRFAGSFPMVSVVLSGMSDMAQMEDNISSMRDFNPLSDREREAVDKVCSIFRSMDLIPCTRCRYCIEENDCPKGILIPEVFGAMNSYSAFHNWNSQFYYNSIITGSGHGRASDCIGCGKCEKVCPQHLRIRDLLKDVARTFGNR